MSPEKDEELCRKYPKIFADRHGDMRQTAMVWGFECGDGWYDLIDTLCGAIQNHLDWVNRKSDPPVPQVVASQVKEKYGSLCFYYCGGDDYIHGAVSLAEALSDRVCEACGAPGEQFNPRGWVLTRCQSCRDALKPNY